MKASPVFLAVEHVLAIHRRMAEEFGGDPEVRDSGLLGSAVMLPAATFGGEFLHDCLPAMAAAYLFHLCKNRPFVDGNRRTALVASEVFLDVNGWGLSATNRELLHLTLRVAAGECSKADVTAFFRRHAVAERRER